MDIKIDHKAEALRLLEESRSVPSDDPGCFALLQDALVHSNLAIVEAQERVAEELKDQNHSLEEIANQLSRAQS